LVKTNAGSDAFAVDRAANDGSGPTSNRLILFEGWVERRSFSALEYSRWQAESEPAPRLPMVLLPESPWWPWAALWLDQSTVCTAFPSQSRATLRQ